MYIHATQSLFAWEALEDSPSLDTIRQFLQLVPDQQLLVQLRLRRHNGNNKYPVHILWGTLLLSIVLRHSTMRACLAELGRNAGLRRLIGTVAFPCTLSMTRPALSSATTPSANLPFAGPWPTLVTRKSGTH